MISSVGAPRLNPDWFVQDGFYAKVKPEFMDQVNKTIDEQHEAQMAACKEAREQLSDSLTDEQMEYLSSKYDPENMSYSDYRDFLNDLCEFGYFAEEDKPFVGCGVESSGSGNLVMIPLSYYSRVSATLTPDTGSIYRQDFTSSGGNVLAWAKHLSTYGTCNSWTGRFEQTDQAKLYGKLYDILSQIK